MTALDHLRKVLTLAPSPCPACGAHWHEEHAKNCDWIAAKRFIDTERAVRLAAIEREFGSLEVDGNACNDRD